jgi:hypothetical protein
LSNFFLLSLSSSSHMGIGNEIPILAAIVAHPL